MPRVSDDSLAELGLRRPAHATYPWSDHPAHKIQRAGLTHAVMSRMLESAEVLAPFVKFDKAVVFGWLRDLVLGRLSGARLAWWPSGRERRLSWRERRRDSSR